MQLACELGIADWQDQPVEKIIAYCAKKITAWIKPFKTATNIDAIQRIVSAKLGLVFEEFRTDEELEKIIQKYTDLGDGAFSGLRDDFGANTFATLMKRANPDPRAHDQYVAVIDYRGDKEARRSFSRWHEIAHLLTLRRQLQFPYHRSTTNKDSMERLMDVIAGEIGFYPPLFAPLLRKESKKAGGLNFEVVESVRRQFYPTASFHSTLIACAKQCDQPVICLEAGMCLRNEEQSRVNSQQRELFSLGKRPSEKLRVLGAVPNKAGRARKLRIDFHMEVPKESVVYDAFLSSPGVNVRDREELDCWRHSDGTTLPATVVDIEARRVGDTVIALIIERSDDRRSNGSAERQRQDEKEEGKPTKRIEC
jgi:hypothetical protein